MDWREEINFYNDYPKLKKEAYKKIALDINGSKSKQILDFGCGDGKQINFIDKEKNIFLYDINKEALNKALENNKEKKVKLIFDKKNIQNDFFDKIICSLVLMCINNKKEYNNIINSFYKYLKLTGEVILLITHPAFREKEFSYYKTKFQKGFNYFEEGLPFYVTFKKLENNNQIIDYHWSLSYTINSFISHGFVLTKMIEMKDKSNDKEYKNQYFPPYLILKFKKQ